MITTRWFGVVLLASSMFSACTHYRVGVDAYHAAAHEHLLRPGTSIAVMPNPEAANPLIAQDVNGKLEALLRGRGYHVTSVDSADLVMLNMFGIGTPTEVSTGGFVVPLRNMLAYVPTSTVTYFRWLLLGIVRREVLSLSDPRPQDAPWVWFVEITSSGSSGDLRQVIDYMLIAAFEHLGVSTGRRVFVKIGKNDRRVRQLRAPDN